MSIPKTPCLFSKIENSHLVDTLSYIDNKLQDEPLPHQISVNDLLKQEMKTMEFDPNHYLGTLQQPNQLSEFIESEIIRV